MSAPAAMNGRAGRSLERRIADVPLAVRLMLVATLALQLGWHAWRPDARAEPRSLGPIPADSALRVAALGEPEVLAKLLMLRLLTHDGQPGVHISFMNLDYERVAEWLDAIIDLDPRADSPLLAAARLYGSVSDSGRQRRMFDLVFRRFLEDPDRRWPWLAHAAVIAKHRLDDPVLALRYARAVSERATGPAVPAWVRDMSGLIAADIGELDVARVLIGGLIHSGRVRDPRELRFLGTRLKEIEALAGGSGAGDDGTGRNAGRGARRVEDADAPARRPQAGRAQVDPATPSRPPRSRG